MLKGHPYSQYAFAALVCFLFIFAGAVQGNDQQSGGQWFSESRIQIHTAIGPSRRGGLKALEINELVEELGVGVYTRHVKSDWRDPLWYGLVAPATQLQTGIKTNRQLFKVALRKAAEKGIRVGAYYWEAGGRLQGSLQNQTDEFVSHRRDNLAETPMLSIDLLCKDKEGNLIPELAGRKIRGWHADLSSPTYREIVLKDLIEIVNFGFSTLFFDERHFPNANQSPCYGASLEKKYRAKYNVQQLVRDWDEKENARFIRFQATEMADTFAYWKTSLRERGFSALFVISGTYLANLIYPHMSIELARVADVVKTEYQHGLRKSIGGKLAEASGLPLADADIRKYLAWLLARDLSDGLPPYVWRQIFQDTDELSLAATEIVFHGAVAGIHVADRLFGERRLKARRSQQKPKRFLDTPLSVIRDGISEVKPYAELYSGSIPYAEIGVLLDEQALLKLDTASERWTSVSHPLQMAVQELYEWGLPFRIITDKHLLNKDLKLDFVLPVGTISEQTSEQLSELAGHGLTLLSVGSSSKHQIVDLDTRNLVELAEESGGIGAFNLRVSHAGRRSALRSTFHETRDGKILVGLICSTNANCNAGKDVTNIQASLLKKPSRAYLEPEGVSLDIEKVEATEWKVRIPGFKSTQLVVLQY